MTAELLQVWWTRVEPLDVVEHVGPCLVRGGSSEEELARIGKGLKQLILPTSAALSGQLAAIQATGIPLQVVNCGWNPAYGVIATRVAELGGGKAIVIKSKHHFPQLVSDEFNQILVAFMKDADCRAQKRV